LFFIIRILLRFFLMGGAANFRFQRNPAAPPSHGEVWG
jgi:hypothetical protein